MQAVAAFSQRVKEYVAANPPDSMAKKRENARIFLSAIIHIILKGFAHGDLKPDNILRDDRNFVIADLGGSKIIQELVDRMNRAYVFANLADKQAVNKVLFRFSNGTVDESFLEANGEVVARLARWGILSLERPKTALFKKKPEPTCGWYVNKEKLIELQKYLEIEPFPSNTRGYAYSGYLSAILDAFWRCDPESYKNACHALDIRAAGLTLYVYFTADTLPRDETDKAYYNNVEAKLRAKAISEKAISIIRRMVEPMPAKEPPFTLPVEVKEIEELIQELIQEHA